MEGRVARREHAEHDEDLEVAPILPGRDLAPDCCGDQGQEGEVDRGCGEPADRGRGRDRDASRGPRENQDEKGLALERQPSGPVRHGSEEKACDHRGEIAIQHLVDMPVARREGGRDLPLAVEQRQPDQDCEPGIERAPEEERAKAVGENCRSGLIAQARDGGHERPPASRIRKPDRFAPGAAERAARRRVRAVSSCIEKIRSRGRDATLPKPHSACASPAL